MNALTNDLAILLPELILAVSGLVLLLWGALRGDKDAGTVSFLAVVAMAVAAYVMLAGDETATAFHGAFVVDGFARFAKVLILLGSALTLVITPAYAERAKLAHFEFPVLVLFATLGMMLMVSAASFIALYMGLELQSLSLYVLASFNRDSVKSNEAGLKYFVLGALSSGMLLYGISLIYGFTGSTEFLAVAHVIKTGGISIGLIFGLVFLIAGLVFKISAVPFHMWTPDVYEGAPTPVTAFFAMAPKVAAMTLLLRALLSSFPDAIHQWQQVIILISGLSMVLGAFAAIGQTNIKRLMAYSSIGHMGFALLGLAAGTAMGVKGVLIYMAIYLVTNAGVWVVVMAMARDGQSVESISDLAGLSRTRPGLAFAMAALMISLAGIPPLAGFWAKFYVFVAAIEAHLYTLSVIGVLSSVVGAYYYWRIVKVMYFDDPAPAFDAGLAKLPGLVLAGASLFTIFFIVGGAPLIAAAGHAAATLVP
ncbi:MAG: NADH-quinone oxidoreductase subunit NuoN [Alphaproteobacteria bacterium]|nr:NADH-quinone oxidoreductase subunit NuoN [Alphaproteobacteria bacterium]MBU6472136.1 NADH-quinone oxidoreductase subunit NuoN [Alphaproteobacteria bacterium]MDE2012782.1 NADH-quinone oxidoreductase subunit NuoN [Alphaproteobacteria bacterium]MDE2073487.1 NADH-quinone oxidoreductase subunit NuoN [Alphaproteobacteria bacterium]MDE2352333.1 NADH-quinone oxidoreductase subunit NuoN [Alphaproteobacteria bacterium]